MKSKDLVEASVFIDGDGGGGGGTTNYNALQNKPKINGVELIGDKSGDDLGLGGGSPLPDGGTTGQALVKKSDTDQDVEWKSVGGGGEYTAGEGIKIENGTISGTKIDVSKGATNVIEVEGVNASKLGFEFGEDVVLSASSPMLFGESIKLQEKLTAGDNITIEDNTISADGEVLVAVYEQTSYADVKAAIDANKAIVLDMTANNNQFCITFSTYTNGGNALMYAIYKMDDKATLMTVTLTPQNQWTISHTDLQDKLVSGTNIKTVNNQSLLGSGNITVGGGSSDDVFEIAYGETDTQKTNDFIDAANSGVTIKLTDIWKVTDEPNDQPVYVSVNSGSSDDWINMDFVIGGDIYRVGFNPTLGPEYTPIWNYQAVGVVGKSYIDTVDTSLQSQIGTLSSLTTTNKGNLVSAINEVAGNSGVNFEVGVEKPYGTYQENGVTYPVYSKIVYIPALPSTAGTTNVPHGITNIKQVLAIYGVGTNSMVLNAPRQNSQDNIAIYQVQKSGNFVIEVGKDRSSMGAYVTLIYAKNN